MKTIHMNLSRPSYKSLREVADIMLAGGVAIYPTDTVYGLGCDIFSKKAMERISRIKKRDPAKPFSIMCVNIEQISEFAQVSNWGFRLMNRTLPGAYTYILEARKSAAPKKMLGKRSTVGVRIPDNQICNKLVELVERPIITTSVNLSGGEPFSDPAMLPESFERYIDVAINVGPLVSEPSTVVDLTGDEPVVIRHGKGEELL
ncbi:Hypothetical YciO protein, TsaC/YrdC paralog [hydrothermal vent metagenome]|uniref:Hypothetical YciO protein, TsaC/YrdC paralog n=1 Tax=hydrothermal vent metagenome TaxID=652676 RepID=A0A3B1CFK7_9ZZZZ